MTQPDKLTIEECEEMLASNMASEDVLCRDYYGILPSCAKQLLDTMRELEAMRQTNERNVETAAEQLKEMKRENERLRSALSFIEFSSHGCYQIYDFEAVTEKMQALMREEKRKLGRIAEEALSNKDSNHNAGDGKMEDK